MVEISEDVLSLYTAELEADWNTYTIEFPQRE